MFLKPLIGYIKDRFQMQTAVFTLHFISSKIAITRIIKTFFGLKEDMLPK